jgi:hypothetical protein
MILDIPGASGMYVQGACDWQASIWIYYGGNVKEDDDSDLGDNKPTATLMMTPMELPGEGLKEKGLNACAYHTTIARTLPHCRLFEIKPYLASNWLLITHLGPFYSGGCGESYQKGTIRPAPPAREAETAAGSRRR